MSVSVSNKLAHDSVVIVDTFSDVEGIDAAADLGWPALALTSIQTLKHFPGLRKVLFSVLATAKVAGLQLKSTGFQASLSATAVEVQHVLNKVMGSWEMEVAGPNSQWVMAVSDKPMPKEHPEGEISLPGTTETGSTLITDEGKKSLTEGLALGLAAQVELAVKKAYEMGIVITVETKPTLPLRMGGYELVTHHRTRRKVEELPPKIDYSIKAGDHVVWSQGEPWKELVVDGVNWSIPAISVRYVGGVSSFPVHADSIKKVTNSGENT